MKTNSLRPGTKVRSAWPELRHGTVQRQAQLNGESGYMVLFERVDTERFVPADGIERLAGGAR